MTKWGDILISAVAYDQKHRVTFVKQHKDTEDSIGEGEIIDGASLASNIKNGKSCVTIYSTLSNWKLGEKLRTYNLDGGFFIRNDKSKVTSDNLGYLQELKVSDEGEEIPETPSLEEKPTPPPKPAAKVPPNVPPKVPPKSLPTPEPQKVPEPKPVPTPEPQKVSEPKPTPSSTRGSLPKPESAPKPPSKPVEKESTPKVKPTLPKSEKGLANKIEQLKELSDQISELEQEVKKIEKPKNQPGKSSSKQGIQVEAYCVKCKLKRTIKDPFETTTKNGRSAIKGKCAKCGTNVFRMGKISKK